MLQRFGPARISPWPNQELVSQVVLRVQLRAQVSLRIVMLPHLVSLPLGFTSVDKEVNGFVERGRYQRTLGLPFLPLRAMGQGATASPRHFRHRPNWRKLDLVATAPIGPAARYEDAARRSTRNDPPAGNKPKAATLPPSSSILLLDICRTVKLV